MDIARVTPATSPTPTWAPRAATTSAPRTPVAPAPDVAVVAGPTVKPPVVVLLRTASGGADLDQVLARGGTVRGLLPPRASRDAISIGEVQAAYFVAEVALRPGDELVRVRGSMPL